MGWLVAVMASGIIGIAVRKLFANKIESAFDKMKVQLSRIPLVIKDRGLPRSTYFFYRTLNAPELETFDLISHLEHRYGRTAFTLGGTPFPVTVVWKNTEELITPDNVLGNLDQSEPSERASSFILKPGQYKRARVFIKRMLEAGPIKYEGHDYCMTQIDLSNAVPKIHGNLGFYYDSILTQYALEWELKKALIKGHTISSLSKKGSLPLREATETGLDPILDGRNRTAALAVSTLLVFNRRNQGYYCLLHRRSADVAVSPNTMHVVPAGMFESINDADFWSIEMNVWRELLEELYGEKELQGTGIPYINDYFRQHSPIGSLLQMIQSGSAEHSVTGLCCDLLTLRPEVCTVLFVKDPTFADERRMQLNWEYDIAHGTGAIPWTKIDEAIQAAVQRFGFSATGTVTLGLGREWIRARHGM